MDRYIVTQTVILFLSCILSDKFSAPIFRLYQGIGPEFRSGKWVNPQTFRGCWWCDAQFRTYSNLSLHPVSGKSVTSDCGVYQLCVGLPWRDPNRGPVTKVVEIFGSGNAPEMSVLLPVGPEEICGARPKPRTRNGASCFWAVYSFTQRGFAPNYS